MTQPVQRAPICSDCRSSKHQDCTGRTTDANHRVVDCTCPPAFGHAPRVPAAQEDAA